MEKNDVMLAFFRFEDWLYKQEKPIEIKAAMYWGALMVAFNSGECTWDEAINLFGEFMSKQFKLR